MKKAVFLGIVILCVFSHLLTVSADSEKAASILADMTLEQKITQMIFPALRTWGPKDSAVNTVELNDELHEIFTDYSFGGVTLYGANIVNTEQTIALICQVYGVNETWLRTGEGEPYRDLTPALDAADRVRRLIVDRSDSVAAAVIQQLLKWEPDGPEWTRIGEFVNSIKETHK